MTRPSVQIRSAVSEVFESRRTTAAELRRRFVGDLDWIVLHTLARKPEDRYASASELAADLERHLAFLPVSVRPPTLSYQLRRFTQRHRARVAVALGALALTLVAAGALWQTRRAAARQTQMAAELNREVERIEWLQRVGHQLPLGSQKNQDQALRSAMAHIETRRGSDHGGLASYALGRGELALGNPQAARNLFETSLQAGYDAPEVHLAMGWALSELYDRRLDTLRRTPDRDLREAQREEADQELRQPALALLSQSTGSAWISPELLEATLALQRDELDLAIDRGRSAAERLGWLYEAHFVVGRALQRQAEVAREMEDNLERAESLFDAAILEVEQGLAIGRSDPKGNQLLCRISGARSSLASRFSRPGFDALLENTEARCIRAQLADPESFEPRLVRAQAWHGMAWHGRSPALRPR